MHHRVFASIPGLYPVEMKTLAIINKNGERGGGKRSRRPAQMPQMGNDKSSQQVLRTSTPGTVLRVLPRLVHTCHSYKQTKRLVVSLLPLQARKNGVSNSGTSKVFLKDFC